MFDPELFKRKADIRGIYPNQINEELAWFTGRYLVRSLKTLTGDKSPAILVGRDGRTSSPAIYSAMLQGIAAEGGVPVAAGLATTDMIQWGVGEQLNGVIAGAMITASHNPPEYNGIKMVMRNKDNGGIDILRPLDQLHPQFEKDGNNAAAPAAACAPFPAQARLDLQKEFTKAACDRSTRLGGAKGKIVLDPGNGVGGLFVPLLKEVLGELGAEVEILAVAEQIDGRFPTRPSNPGLPGAVKLLQETVIEQGAAFGAAFDGDADRVFLVDEWGQFVSGSLMLAALARNYVSAATSGDKCVVYAAVASWLVPQTVRAAGGTPIICRVGQDAAKVALVKTDAVFGGESSAHYNFPDKYCLDSGLFALIGFWDMLLASGKSCSELLSELKPWPNSGEVNLRFTCSDWQSVSRDVISAVRNEFSTDEKNCYILDLDGVSVLHPRSDKFATVDDVFQIDKENDAEGLTYRVVQDYTPEWWFNIRASNNEPLLRVNFESRESADVAAKTYALISRIRELCNGRATVAVQDWGNLK
ncbi:MAG: hypothetical protein KDA69_00655 [Planctomycetaceae bacterium]|nr:hypothetical protein [Planctomycetaceae bacterium]